MNSKRLMAALVVLAAMIVATSAFATNIELTKAASFNGTQLAPGNYKVVYSGTGSDVHVNLMRGKNTVASAPAHIEERDTKASYDAVVTENGQGSVPVVKQIVLGGKKQVLVLSESAEGASGSGNR